MLPGPEYEPLDRGTAYGALPRGTAPGDVIRPPDPGDGGPYPRFGADGAPY
jgi:hypothetical protein